MNNERLFSSGPAGLQFGALPHQVHREHQPEDLPRVQLGLRPGLGRDHLRFRRGHPLLPQPQELRDVLLAPSAAPFSLLGEAFRRAGDAMGVGVGGVCIRLTHLPKALRDCYAQVKL